MRNFLKNKKGEVVVESSIVLTIAVIFLIVLIYLGLMIYQQTLVSIVANQAAANVAQVYSNEAKDPFTGYVDASSLNNSGMITKMKNEAYQEVIAQKAQWYSHYRLRTLKILNTGNPKVDVSVEPKPGELMKSQVVVTIEDEFIMPIAGFFGSEGKMKIKATGRADCFDILDTVNLGTAIIEDADVIAVTENYKVRFITDRAKNTLFAEREVMQNTSFSDTNNYNQNYYKGFPVEQPVDPDNAHFYGWETAGGELFTDKSVVRSNMEVYAIWKYTVRFDANGGTVSPGSKDVRKGDKIGTLPTPVKSGATFDGWFTPDGKKVTPDTIVTKDMTLKAQWKYLVKFDLNGGSFKNGNVAPFYVIEGKTIGSVLKAMPEVTKSGREFYRWEENGKQITVNTVVNKNITAKAIWKYTVTLNATGGTVDGAGKKTYHVAPGDTFHFASDKYKATRSGYSFVGWYSGDTKYNASQSINGDVTVNARWNCTVTFKNGSTTVKTIYVLEGKTIGSAITSMPSASQSGRKFYRWEIDGAEAKLDTVIKKATTVNAKYKYVVIFKNDGSEIARFHKVPGEIFNFAKESPKVTKKQHTFNGWYSGGTKYGGNTRITGDLTVEASWSFNCNHPNDKRYETGRTGTRCSGGTIYYQCGQCNNYATQGSYGGSACVFSARCDRKHSMNHFLGIASGGCGWIHRRTSHTCSSCSNANDVRTNIYAYCRVCQYCHRTDPDKYVWCANPHANTHSKNSYRPSTNHSYKGLNYSSIAP